MVYFVVRSGPGSFTGSKKVCCYRFLGEEVDRLCQEASVTLSETGVIPDGKQPVFNDFNICKPSSYPENTERSVL
ncbi:hypothetical protein ED312_09820 [Sinomicrobium pectinilyticum]|uniref:Uncharacterized protein n=1 Tax=Sinomicrobium pectinilyticum TaxID=1084421 RepID=A0A3N0EIZ5_SINP1|nr:hypothetical protein ED312_09820 [Sinomicrobium pectinilyticum]